MIPKVAASEIGGSLNLVYVIDCIRCAQGVVGLSEVIAVASKSYKVI